MSAEPSKRVLDLLRAESASIRRRDLRLDREALARALEPEGLEPHEALCAFEDRFGGADGSGMVLGVLPASQRSGARLPGHALVARRGHDDFFMAPDGAMVAVEDGQPITVSGSADALLEQLALRREIETKQNAIYLRLRGAPAAELARGLGAKRDRAASDRVDCWVLPKGQGLLLGPWGDEAATLALVPSVRAAARCLAQGVRAVSVTPIKLQSELGQAEEAPRRAAVLAQASFEPYRRGPLEHVVELSPRAQDFVLEQWSFTADEGARAHWLLRDGGARFTVFLGVPPSSTRCPGALSGVELAFDPLLRCGSDEELETLLFARGFTSFPGALAFDRRFGGLSFWTLGPAVLGIASALRRDLRLVKGEIGTGVPIADAEGRSWRLLPTGVVETVEDDCPPQRFPDVDSFAGFLAQHARPWRRSPYRIEA